MCQCQCHLIADIKTLYLVFASIHWFAAFTILLLIIIAEFNTYVGIIGFGFISMHLLLMIISMVFSSIIQTKKNKMFKPIVIFSSYFVLIIFFSLSSLCLSFVVKLDLIYAMINFPTLSTCFTIFFFNLYILVLILLKKINVNKFTPEYNSNRIFCSSCTKYCTVECNDDPPSYQLFEPPSYEEING